MNHTLGRCCHCLASTTSYYCI